MEEKVVYWRDIKRKMEFENMKRQIKEAPKKAWVAAKAGVKWCEENPILACTMIAGGIEVMKTGRAVIRHAEKRDSDLRYYDRGSQQYMRLKKRLTPRMKDEAYLRHLNGERYTDIYKDMGVL